MAMGLNKQIQFVRQPKPTDGEIIAQVAVFDGEGNPVDVGGAPTAYTLPAATAEALGGVKKGAAIPDLASGADAAVIATKVNSILAQLRAIGVIAV